MTYQYVTRHYLARTGVPYSRPGLCAESVHAKLMSQSQTQAAIAIRSSMLSDFWVRVSTVNLVHTITPYP